MPSSVARRSVTTGFALLLSAPGIAAAQAPAPRDAAPARQRGEVIAVANASRLERLASLGAPGSFITGVAFLPDGRTVLTGDRNGEVLAWDVGTWARHTLQAPISSREGDDASRVPFYGVLAVAPDGRAIVTASPAPGVLTLRDAAGRETGSLSYGSPTYATAVSPDGRLLAVGGLAGDIAIHDLATGRRVADLRGEHVYVSVLVFSPDGRTLVAGYERPGNVLKAWSTATWREAFTFGRMTERIDWHDAVFTPDGQGLLVGRTPADIELIDLGTREVVRRFAGHGRAPYQLALSPDGSLLASAADDGTVRLWDRSSGNAVRTIDAGAHELYSVAFSPDGTLLAFSVSGEGVQVWGIGR